MQSKSPFDKHHEQYDKWYEKNRAAYQAELAAIRPLLPDGGSGIGIEIGVGTGRFAAPLGARFGIDPSGNMLSHAVKRGVVCARAVAEALPFRESVFDFAILVTALCVIDDAVAAVREAVRVTKKKGAHSDRVHRAGIGFGQVLYGQKTGERAGIHRQIFQRRRGGSGFKRGRVQAGCMASDDFLHAGKRHRTGTG